MKNILICIFLILILSAGVSCSGGGNAVTAPVPAPKDAVSSTSNGTYIPGFWQVVIDTDKETIDAVDMRTSDLILNVLGFLEPPPLSNMTIDFDTLFIDPDSQTISVDVILRHPLASPEFKGFDVRGVVFGPWLTNHDGLTITLSPEFFSGVPFGYVDGLLGAPDSFADYEGLAGFKYFCDDLGAEEDLLTFMSDSDNLANRGVFSEGPQQNRRHYVLDWTDSDQDFFIFNYAIYANYNWPTGEAPYTMDDFDISTSNGAEAFCAQITEVSNTLNYASGIGGGSLSLDVEVWDWQGNESTEVKIDTLTGGDEALAGSWDAGSTAYSGIFHIVDYSPTVTSTAPMDFIITVSDEKTYGEAWFLGLLPTGHALYDEPVHVCYTYTAEVSEMPAIHVINPPNIDIITGYLPPKDISINPASYQVAVSYEDYWVNWTNDYTTASAQHTPWGSHDMGYIDGNSTFLMYRHDYHTTYNSAQICWTWADWTGWQSGSSYWNYGYDHEIKDIAHLPGTNQVWHILDAPTDPYVLTPPVCRFMYSLGDDHMIYPAYGYQPWYGAAGTAGVVCPNVRGIDFPQYSGSGNPTMYFLEALPASNTGVVEEWFVSTPPVYQGSFGENDWYDPLDITVDSNYNVYILEVNSDGAPEIWAYDPDGVMIARSGALTSAEISGDPLRIETHLYADPDEVHVLHTDGVTKFTMY